MQYDNITIGALKKCVDFFEILQKKFDEKGVNRNATDYNDIALTAMRNMIKLYETREYAIVPIKEMSAAAAAMPGKRVVLVLDKTDSPCPYLPIKDRD